MQVTRLACLLVAAAVVGCGGGGGDDGGTTNPPPPPPPPTTQTLGSITTSVTTLNLTAGSTADINVSAFDTQGGVIANPPAPSFTISSGAGTIAEVDGAGVVLAIGAGTTSVSVSLTMGSVTRTAAVAVTVTGILPSAASVSTTSGDVFSPNKVVIGRGGSVTWTFGATTHNVTFGSTAGAPGNITDTYGNSQSRTFASNGNFSYSCTLHAGMNGQVVVR